MKFHRRAFHIVEAGNPSAIRHFTPFRDPDEDSQFSHGARPHSSRSPGDMMAGIPPVPSRPCVLLVEDHEVNQELIAEILDGMGYEVIVAESGEVAVDLAERTRFAAILMDRRLPGIDGLEASLRIGEAAGGSPPPIILVTADISTAAPDDARWRYIRAFVTKPVDWRHLQETLNGVIK